MVIKLPVPGSLVKCSKCGREILVERGLIGVDHTIEIFVTCWECLDTGTKQKAIKKYKLKPMGG